MLLAVIWQTLQRTYTSVVIQESLRIALLITVLNDLDILTSDIGNAYLNAYTTEKNSLLGSIIISKWDEEESRSDFLRIIWFKDFHQCLEESSMHHTSIQEGFWI